MHIVDQQSVLGIVDAWLAHRDQGGDDLLVVVHPLDDGQLGWDVRGHAVRRGTLTVDLATIVQRRFGATDLDPRVRQNRWLVEGLLDAEPTVGWRRGGPVLTLDVAVRALLAARLGFDDPPDAGTLLDWSRGPGPARFRALPAEERAGLTAWLYGTVGGVAGVLMALVADGRAADAMALGIVAAVLDEPRASADDGRRRRRAARRHPYRPGRAAGVRGGRGGHAGALGVGRRGRRRPGGGRPPARFSPSSTGPTGSPRTPASPMPWRATPSCPRRSGRGCGRWPPRSPRPRTPPS